MEHKIFAIYDQKAHAFLPPFTLHRRELAARTFADCINSKDHAFSRHPGDYTLIELGEYDDTTGRISPYEVAETIGNGLIYVADVETVTEEHHGKLESISNDAPVLSGAGSGNSA